MYVNDVSVSSWASIDSIQSMIDAYKTIKKDTHWIEFLMSIISALCHSALPSQFPQPDPAQNAFQAAINQYWVALNTIQIPSTFLFVVSNYLTHVVAVLDLPAARLS